MNKQKLALFIVLILLALAVVWSVISFPRQKTVTGPKTALAPRQTAATLKNATTARVGVSAVKPAAVALVGDDRTLRLDLLEREQSGFKGYRRNIFKPLFTDEIKLMKQKAVAFKPLSIPPVAVVVPPPQPVQPLVQHETHQSTLAHFTFLGFLKKNNLKTIFLSKDKDIVLVRKGETFAKRYEATGITDQALTIRVIDTGEEIVIPLAENKPLSAAPKK